MLPTSSVFPLTCCEERNGTVLLNSGTSKDVFEQSIEPCKRRHAPCCHCPLTKGLGHQSGQQHGQPVEEEVPAVPEATHQVCTEIAKAASRARLAFLSTRVRQAGSSTHARAACDDAGLVGAREVRSVGPGRLTDDCDEERGDGEVRGDVRGGTGQVESRQAVHAAAALLELRGPEGSVARKRFSRGAEHAERNPHARPSTHGTKQQHTAYAAWQVRCRVTHHHFVLLREDEERREQAAEGQEEALKEQQAAGVLRAVQGPVLADLQ